MIHNHRDINYQGNQLYHRQIRWKSIHFRFWKPHPTLLSFSRIQVAHERDRLLSHNVWSVSGKVGNTCWDAVIIYLQFFVDITSSESFMLYTELNRYLKNQYLEALFQLRHQMVFRQQMAKHRHLCHQDVQVKFVVWLFSFNQCKSYSNQVMQKPRSYKSWSVKTWNIAYTLISQEQKFMGSDSSIQWGSVLGWIDNMATDTSSSSI